MEREGDCLSTLLVHEEGGNSLGVNDWAFVEFVLGKG